MDPTLATLAPQAAAPAATSSGTPSGPPAGAAPSPLASDFNTFLRMLTVQMQNQDPLNPIDSSDYAVQLATFSGVEQQVRTNALLTGLAGQLTLSGLSDMAAWVGREARAPMPVAFDGSPVTISPNPAAIADKVELVVLDEGGQEISREAIPNSADPIEWAGVTSDGAPLPSGTYAFRIDSWSGEELLLSEPAEIYATVTEVRSIGGQTALVMQGGILVAATAVSALRSAPG